MRPLYLPLILSISVTFTFLMNTSPAWSEEKEEEDINIVALSKNVKITIAQAIKTGLEKAQGLVVEVEAGLDKENGKTVWEVQALNVDEVLTVVLIDAVSGEVLDAQQLKE